MQAPPSLPERPEISNDFHGAERTIITEKVLGD
jgi:hypothetical protein